LGVASAASTYSRPSSEWKRQYLVRVRVRLRLRLRLRLRAS